MQSEARGAATSDFSLSYNSRGVKFAPVFFFPRNFVLPGIVLFLRFGYSIMRLEE